MITTALVDTNNSNMLSISDEGAINVVMHAHPPVGEKNAPLPLRAYFLNSSASNVMAVNGSTTSVDFYVQAQRDYDVYVKTISVVIGDGGTPSLSKFGSLTALTNGVAFVYRTNELGEYTLHEGMKSNLSFIRIGSATGAIGTGTEAYLADVSGGGTEKSYLPTIDIQKTYGLMWGIRLRKGTTDRLIFRIRDDLTGLTTFNAVAYGIRI